jgi:hypothetical protein
MLLKTSSHHPETKTDREQTRGQEIESLNHHKFNLLKFNPFKLMIFISFRVLTLFNSYKSHKFIKEPICHLNFKNLSTLLMWLTVSQ